ncbi:metal binding domain of Ada-domain-containing protein [Aspergillus leporis]|uniref:Metal binding domain of Ada-domain-containing protein n=1 Tax=Aspergillus leporis TaxID=41062 RepID=A0A5N5XEW5_9EURO|nr:metal binding domain of Ada-domain-containing protein [Aspergillus leporis]
MVEKNPPQKIPRLIGCATPPVSASVRWQAVIRRDATADSFVYAVLTTKIYCRASCPARLARRANVQFYDTPSQAETAGFRPCKRCKPQTLLAVNPQVQMVQAACKTIQSEIAAGSKPTLRKLADQVCLTPSHFHRVFKKIMGVTPGHYAAVITKGGSREPLEGCSRDLNMAQFQPCGSGADHESCFTNGLEGIDMFDPGDAVIWNDFDALIAVEAELEPGLNAQLMNNSISLSNEDFLIAAECHGPGIGNA